MEFHFWNEKNSQSIKAPLGLVGFLVVRFNKKNLTKHLLYATADYLYSLFLKQIDKMGNLLIHCNTQHQTLTFMWRNTKNPTIRKIYTWSIRVKCIFCPFSSFSYSLRPRFPSWIQGNVTVCRRKEKYYPTNEECIKLRYLTSGQVSFETTYTTLCCNWIEEFFLTVDWNWLL